MGLSRGLVMGGTHHQIFRGTTLTLFMRHDLLYLAPRVVGSCGVDVQEHAQC